MMKPMCWNLGPLARWGLAFMVSQSQVPAIEWQQSYEQ
jgi:hypothetical protein